MKKAVPMIRKVEIRSDFDKNIGNNDSIRK